MNMQFRRVLLVASAASALIAGAPALAQPSQSSASGQVGLDEVVVTAQRRTERLQDVPIAVTAFSEQALQAAQIEETTDLVRFTPSVTGGLNTGTGSALTFYIRGLGSTEQIATFDVPVATYVDEIYFARQSVNAVTLFDIERVEVLRGPQGTLFGRNTTGGAVSITTRKPGTDFGGFVEGEFASHQRYQLRGSVDMPVGDTLLTKLSAFWIDDGGYARSFTTGETLNGEEAYGLRGAVRWIPSDRLTWDVSLDYIDQSRTTIGFNPLDPRYFSRTGLRQGECEDDTFEDLLVRSRGNCARVQTGGITSNLSYDFDLAEVSLISGYRVIDQNFSLDFFNGAGPRGGYTIANKIRNHQHTQELKLVGGGDRIDWVAGLFFLDEQSKTEEIDVFNSALLLADWVMKNKTRSSAAYAQVDFRVTDALTLTAGGRYTEEDKDLAYLDGVQTPYPPGIVVAVQPPANRPTSANVAARGVPLSLSTEKFTPRLALTWKIDPDKMVYASATQGFKSGGWNTRVTNVNAVNAFGPEEAWSYELGARTDWLDDRLRVNLTLYHQQVEDLQLLSGAGGAFSTRNFGDLEATGLEFEISANPIEPLELFLNGQISDKKYVNTPPGFGAGGAPCSNIPEPAQCITTSDTPVRYPDFQATFGATYTVPLGDVDMSLNGAVSYSDVYWTSTFNDTGFAVGSPFLGGPVRAERLSYVPPTTLVNLSAVFRPADESWEAAVGCSNCSEEYYPTSSLFGLGYYNEPRRFFVRLRRNF
jgi:iron complex outermembrane receptor protein